MRRRFPLRLLFAPAVSAGVLALAAAPVPAAASRPAARTLGCAPASAGCPVAGVLYVAASPAVPTEGGSCSAPDYNTITAAVAAAVSGDVIHVCAGTWRENELVLGAKDSLSFIGDSAATTILDGELIEGTAGSRHRIIDADGLTVNLASITLRHGAVSSDGGAVRATVVNGTDCAFDHNVAEGGSFGGGAIWVTANTTLDPDLAAAVTLTRCTFTSNGSSSTPGGGAVYANGGTVTLVSDTFTSNQANDRGGAVLGESITSTSSSYDSNTTSGLASHGGAILAQTMSSTLDTFTGNHTDATGFGGAVWGGNITVDRSSFVDNDALGGGAIGAVDTSPNDVSVVRSFFSSNGNSATYGGGIYNTSGSIHAANSTFVANDSYFGGAVMAGTDMVLANDTFSANTGSSTIGAAMLSGGTVLLANNILDTPQNGCWLSGTVTDSGGNITTDPQGGTFNCAGSQTTSAALNLAGSAADNGGPVKTLLIHRGSAALDAGVDAICGAAPTSGVDARGVARPFGDHCDAGAFELTGTNCCIFTTFSGGLYLPSQTVTVSFTIATAPGRPIVQSVPNATGSVDFYYCYDPVAVVSCNKNSGTKIGSSVPLVNGEATLSNWLPPSGVGHYLIYVYFAGDDYYVPLWTTFAPVTVVLRLPDTGADPAPTLGLAGLLMAVGAVLVATQRRRSRAG